MIDMTGYEEYLDSLEPVCECEIDWNCALHKNQGTHLETRFDLDDYREERQ